MHRSARYLSCLPGALTTSKVISKNYWAWKCISGARLLVRRIEHTRFAPRKLLDLSLASIAGYELAVGLLKHRYPAIEYTIPYLSEIYKHAPIEWFAEAEARLEGIQRQLQAEPSALHHVITSASGYEYFAEHLADYDNAFVHGAPNVAYGGSVTVARGLLTNQDVFRLLDQVDMLRGIVILPRETYYNLFLRICLGLHEEVADR